MQNTMKDKKVNKKSLFSDLSRQVYATHSITGIQRNFGDSTECLSAISRERAWLCLKISVGTRGTLFFHPDNC